jgi:hypothetical protein
MDERGFVFYTNYESRKGGELLAHPLAAMCFHWQPLERQVRIEGRVVQVSDEEADAYFATRERGSQIGAWASRQSRPMEHPGALDERVRETGSALRRRSGAEAAALVGVPPGPGTHRVLAQHAQSPARAPRLQSRRRRLAHRAPVPLVEPSCGAARYTGQAGRGQRRAPLSFADGNDDREHRGGLRAGSRLDDREGSDALQHRRVGRGLLRHRRARPRRGAPRQGASRAASSASTTCRATWKSRGSRCRCSSASPTSCARASRR